MDQLPPELLGLVLKKNVEMCRCNKNGVLDLRLVCHAFNDVLKPSIFKTIQLEFSRFSQFRDIDDNPDRFKTLQRIGPLSSSFYIDMMVVRDPGMRTFHHPVISIFVTFGYISSCMLWC